MEWSGRLSKYPTLIRQLLGLTCGLKIRVSVVRFRPWPPIQSVTYPLLFPARSRYPYTAIGSPIASSMGTEPIPGPSGATIRPPATAGGFVTVAVFRPFG